MVGMVKWKVVNSVFNRPTVNIALPSIDKLHVT